MGLNWACHPIPKALRPVLSHKLRSPCYLRSMHWTDRHRFVDSLDWARQEPTEARLQCYFSFNDNLLFQKLVGVVSSNQQVKFSSRSFFRVRNFDFSALPRTCTFVQFPLGQDLCWHLTSLRKAFILWCEPKQSTISTWWMAVSPKSGVPKPCADSLACSISGNATTSLVLAVSLSVVFSFVWLSLCFVCVSLSSFFFCRFISSQWTVFT